MPDDMTYPHRCQHCNVSIRRGAHPEAYVDQHGMTGSYNPHHLHEPTPMTGSIHDEANQGHLVDHLNEHHDVTPWADDHGVNVMLHHQSHDTGAHDAEQDLGMHGIEHEPMGGAQGVSEHVPYNPDNDRRALEWADMSEPETTEHHYDEAGSNAPSHNETLFHRHDTGHQIHVVPPGRPGGRHDVRIDSPDGESEYPERFGKDIALDRPDDMPISLRSHIHQAFDHAEAMDKAPRNQPVHHDEVPLAGEGLDDYLKRMRERDNKVHENLPANHPSREAGDSDLHEYGNESQLHGHLMDPAPHGHGYHDDPALDAMRRAGGPLRDLHRHIHTDPDYHGHDISGEGHTHEFSLDRRDRTGPVSGDDGIHRSTSGDEIFNNSWGRGTTGTGHAHNRPEQYLRPNNHQRQTELAIHLSAHHGYDRQEGQSWDDLAQMHVTHHGGDLSQVGGGRHNGGVDADPEGQHDWRHRHLQEDHGISRSIHMSDDALNELHETAHETGVMNEDHSHEPHPDSRNHHPSDCVACAAGEGMSHNYEAPSDTQHPSDVFALRRHIEHDHGVRNSGGSPTSSRSIHEREHRLFGDRTHSHDEQGQPHFHDDDEGHTAMKTIAMNAKDDEGHFAHVNLLVPDAYEAGLALLRQARVQMQGSLTKVAHDSGDGETIYHCPFCGSGQVVARSDRTIECDFCHTSFTVQVQPEFSAFPQTIDGAPVDVPGMPGQIQQNDPNATSDGPMDPSQLGDDGGDPSSFAGPPGPNNQPPWLKGAFRTESGAVLDEDAFVRHLALKVSENDPGVLMQVRAENLA